MQIKPQGKTTLYPLRWLLFKKKRDNKCWWGWGESLHIAGWNVNGTDTVKTGGSSKS